MCGGGGGGCRVRISPLKNKKKISKGFSGNTGPDPRLKNHKVAKPAFNVGPSSARHRHPLTKLSGSAHGKHIAYIVLLSIIRSNNRQKL